MRHWLVQLDELLRGERTNADALASGEVRLPLRVFVPFALTLGCAYGFFMGWYAMADPRPDGWKQLFAGTLKLPMLFLLTLGVTFPSLYVFNALVGCRIGFGVTLRLLVGTIVINLAVAASLGPILAFFTLSTTSYAFMVLLNVALLGVAGVIALAFLLKTLQRLEPPREPTFEGDATPQPAAHRIFRVWIILYGVVGAQMGWLLRPFIGAPGSTFELFRPREGNVLLSVVNACRHLLGL